MPTSPNILNYTIGKGYVYWQGENDTAERCIGECKDFTITADSSLFEHATTQEGVGTTDFSFIEKMSSTVKFTPEEITPENIAMMMLGTAEQATNGDWVIDVLTEPSKIGTLRLYSNNAYGAKVDWEGNVTLAPAGDIAMLTSGSDLMNLPITAKVNKDPVTGRYGRFTVRAQEGQSA